MPIVFAFCFCAIMYLLDSHLVLDFRISLTKCRAEVIKDRLQTVFPNSHEGVSEALVNEWLGGTLPQGHFFLQTMGAPFRDHWEYPYRCITSSTEAGEAKYHIYSLGQNGLSNSAGNDADDLNTWDENCDQWYREKLRESQQKKSVIWGGILTGVIWLGYFFLSRQNKGVSDGLN